MGGREKGRKAVKVMIFSRPFEAHDGERDGQIEREKRSKDKRAPSGILARLPSPFNTENVPNPEHGNFLN